MLVFDVALEHMGCWVIDYVEEVCGDPALTSNDPAEAQLLDGEFVRSWCEKTLQQIESAVVAALMSDQQFRQFQATQLHTELGKVSILLSVLEALERIRNVGDSHVSAGPSRRRVDTELMQATLLQQCFQVMAWCACHALHEKPHTGRFASVPDWMRQVHRRRDKLQNGRTLFLDDILQALHIGGAYPFSSLQNMLYMLFITIRDSNEKCWTLKLSLLLYHLLDLDYLQPVQQEDFRLAFSISAPLAACWKAMFYLDCVEQSPGVISPLEQTDPAAPLQLACQLLTSQVQGTTPFKVVQALVSLGRSDAALSLHWSQAGSKTASASDIKHAITLLELRLRCGLLNEAFLAMRAHCYSLQEPQRSEHARVLVVHLADWASTKTATTSVAAGEGGTTMRNIASYRSPLHLLFELPWDATEEDALVGWLNQQLLAGKAAGDLLPLYFLGRGQVPEALGSYNLWQLRKQGQSSRDSASVQPMVDALVNAAAGLLPVPQRNICIGEAPGASEACWPAKLLVGLSLQADSNEPVLHATVSADQAPPFMTSRLPAQPKEVMSPVTGSLDDSVPFIRTTPALQDPAENDGVEASIMFHDTSVSLDAGPPLFCLPLAPGRTTALFELSLSAAAETVTGFHEGGCTPLFGTQRDGAADSRDPKRARMHSAEL